MSLQLTATNGPVPLFGSLYVRSLREIRRILVVVVAVPLVVPVFMLTVFAPVFSGLLRETRFDGAENYVQYVAPATLLMAVMLSATSAVSVAVERQTGFYDRMRISPAGPTTSNLARRVADATKLLAFALVLVLVSWAAGAPVRDWPLVLALGTLLPAAWGFAYGGIAFAACLRTGRPEVAEALLPAFFPLLFASSAFVPVSALPGWMGAVAAYNPLTFLADAIRAAYQGRVDGSALTLSVVSIVVLAALTGLATRAAERRVAAGG